MKSRFVFAAFAIIVALAPVQSAHATLNRIYEKTAQSGKPTRLFSFFNCGRHVIAIARGAFVEHGTIEYKDATQKRCGNADEPVVEVWYTSNPGFVGVDVVTMPMGATQFFITHVAVGPQ